MTFGAGNANTAPDAFVPSGLAESFAGLTTATAEPPAPHREPEAFYRGTTVCKLCQKVIGGEAMALDDGRTCHSTCVLCSRCGIRLDEYRASGLRLFCEGCAPRDCEAVLHAVALEDEGDKLSASEWYYSDGDSSEGPVTLSRLKIIFKAGKLTADGYVWGSHMAEGSDWAQLSSAEHARLLHLLQPPGSTSAGGRPSPAAPSAGLPPTAPVAVPSQPVAGGATAAAGGSMAAPWMDAAESCAGCGGALVMDALAALGQKWHPACFVCGTCGGAFDGTFMEHEGRPYHKDCYNQNCQASWVSNPRATSCNALAFPIRMLAHRGAPRLHAAVATRLRISPWRQSNNCTGC